MIEKELLVVVHSLNKFRHYITFYHSIVHNDHVVIKYVMNKPDLNIIIIIWFLLLQHFDLTIIDKPSRENVIAGFLSRLAFPTGQEGMVDDRLLDEHLFAISLLSPWLVNIGNYLVVVRFPPNLSSN